MKILVVDDDADSQGVTKITLEAAGYAVETASDGIDALHKMEQGPPDLIISDILMPRMDGFVFCRQCKAHPHYAQIPFIFLTATYLDSRDEELARRLGVELFLVKPQTPKALADAVRSAFAEPRSGEKRSQQVGSLSEHEFSMQHEEALRRKLEDKIAELEKAGQAMERDIAARGRTEALFKGLFDNSPIGIELYDRVGNLIDANRACLALFGVSGIDAVKKFNLFDDPNLDETMKRDLRSGRIVETEILFDFDLVTKHGIYPTVRTGKAVLDVHLSALRLDADGIAAAYVVHVRDITERRKAVEALKESENVLRALINANPEAVTLLNAGGIVLACNEAVGARLGKPSSAIIGTCLWDLFPGDLGAKRKKHVEELFRTGKAVQFTDRRGDRIIENHCHPVIDAAGGVTACAVTSVDITERVAAERAVQRQAQILDQIQESVITTDLDGIITGWNKGAERLYSYSAQEVLGRHVSIIYPDEGRAVLEHDVIAPLLAKGEHESEVRLRRKSGEEFTAMVQLTLLCDEQGNVVGMIGSSRDITQRKRAEEALRESEQRFAIFMNHLPAAAFLKDEWGKTLYANAQLVRLFTSTDWPGKKTEELLPPAVAEQMAADDRLVLSEDRLLVKEERLSVGGEERIFETSKFPIHRTGKPVMLGGIAVDITARKRAEEALHASEKMLRDITDHVGEGIYVFDAAGMITFMNPEAERLFGWTLEEMNNAGAHALVHHRKSDGTRLPYAECPMHNVARTGEPHISQDEVFVRKDGTVFPIAAISTPIREGESIVASVTAFRDITEQKRTEREREQLIADLQQALAQVKQLSGLLPICAACKKIRDDKGYWTQIEAYVTEHSEAEFSHGLCPECADKYYKKYNIARE